MIVWSKLSSDFKLAQSDTKFKFGTDAVLLANFANLRKNDILADLCSGSGAVGYLCFLRYKQNRTFFVDFDSEMIELSKITAKENNIDSFFKHYCININELSNSLIKNHSISHITVNPPYFKENSGKINEKNDIKNARHTFEFSLDTLFEKSYNMLKDGGKISIIHRCEYTTEIFSSMLKQRIEPKKIRFVHSYIDSKAKLVLIQGMKNAKSGLEVLSPLILYKEKNILSDEFRKISEFYQN